MGDWVDSLPVLWLAVLVFAATFLAAAAIYVLVMRLAVGERARAFKGVSPGMLPPLGILFGLLFGFLAAQVWSDAERAQTAVNREASSLRAAVLLAGAFPGEPQQRLHALIRRHIDDVVTREWPSMRRHRATLTMIPAPLADALGLAFRLAPSNDGQVAAQRELVAALQSALDARRQRIIVSRSTVDWVKWTGLLVEAALVLVAVAIVHSDNRTTAAIAMTIFAAAIAIAVVLIASHNRPYSGQVSVGPDLLLQVLPDDGGASSSGR